LRTTAKDDHAVYRTDADASVNLCLSQPAAWTNTPKRREQNLIVRSGKSEAEVTTNKKRRSRHRTAEANYRHKTLRGLSATAELPVRLLSRLGTGIHSATEMLPPLAKGGGGVAHRDDNT